ncbi:site-specific integrase [Pseudonocardia kujensis]|uniref:tyrosine-type recombinase/integrase n=1 Tax=Pseudonocardia kujensis TaxID=1128675 RepID=UPI001E29BEB2|nr:site-specific integrase [Pseudonocardia kujensis]MCE0763486.1 site-specific integrase [Pseudonocardia kujensis]
MRVYAGWDTVTGRRHYLTEITKPGPRARAQAEAARTRMLNEVDERRSPRTSATVNQLLDRYLEMIDVSSSTPVMYTRYLENHVRPFIGELKAGAVDPDALDSLYAELRRCRIHCRPRSRQIDHRTPRPHECDERCGPHVCKPLSNTTIRHIHHLLSGAYKRAVRWRWVATSPVAQAEAPAPKPPDPRPPTPAEAAKLIEEASLDPDWGALVWFTMTTGARRGEVCALRWRNVDLEQGLVEIRRALATDGHRNLVEKDTKTHQQRRVTIDDETRAVLTEHRARAEEAAAQVGKLLTGQAYVFSQAPDSSESLVPSSVGQRYTRMAKRLGIETHFHALRHYSATELIAAGMDVRTVARAAGTQRRPHHHVVGLQRMAGRGRPARRRRDRGATAGATEDGGIRERAREDGATPPVREGRVTVYKALHLLEEWGLVLLKSGGRPIVLETAEIDDSETPTPHRPSQLRRSPSRRSPSSSRRSLPHPLLLRRGSSTSWSAAAVMSSPTSRPRPTRTMPPSCVSCSSTPSAVTAATRATLVTSPWRSPIPS